jgi:hypothetical protein
MRQFVVKSTAAGELRSIEVFEADQVIDAAVAAEMAEIEGLEVEAFLGADLLDVVRSYPAWFGEGE